MSKFLAGLVTGILITTAFFILRQRQAFNNLATNSTSTEIPSTIEEENPDDGSLPHDFVMFYDRFHTDSLYQLAHILFPLEGLPPDADSTIANSGDFRWQREDWVIHKHFNSMDGNFTQQLIPLGDAMVIEQIRHSQAAYGMQRRFAKMGDEWQLIYYGAMNKLAE